MNSKFHAVTLLLVSCLFLVPQLRAQDPDVTRMLKEAEQMQKEAAELQKKNPSTPATKKKLAEMEAEAKADAAREEQEEKLEKKKLQAALKKQLEAPGPVALPGWTPATPQLKADGPAAKKIVDDEVRITVTGTSQVTPKELADSWEAAATAANNLNHGRNNISVNGDLTTIIFLSTRTDPEEKVELRARRAPGEKITQVTISSPLPKPNVESE